MIEPLRIDVVTRRDLRNNPNLLPEFQEVLSQAADQPEVLRDKRFFIPSGTILLAAFHAEQADTVNDARPDDITPIRGRLVGAAFLDVFYEPQISCLSALAVRSDLQRQRSGIAPRLLEKTFAISTEKEMLAIRLHTAKHSAKWLRVYFARYGFHKITLSSRVLEKILPAIEPAES